MFAMKRSSRPKKTYPHFAKKSNITASRLTLLPRFLRRDSCIPPAAPKEGFMSSKSIFREIKTKLGREHSELEKGLLARIRVPLELKESAVLKGEIQGAVGSVNLLLLDQGIDDMSLNRKRGYNDDEKENFGVKFPYVPPSSWVFQTPPNRKLNFANIRNTQSVIKPAVIETQKEKMIVYEMRNKINVDLRNFQNQQTVDIDKRYMMEVTEDQETSNDASGAFELENHFLSLTCRPKKAISPKPRFPNMKRKRDIFEEEGPPQPSCSSDSDTFLDALNLTPIEQSFNFKFTSDENSSTTGKIFDFEGNEKTSFNFRL